MSVTTMYWVIGLVLLAVFIMTVPYLLVRRRPERRVRHPRSTRTQA